MASPTPASSLPRLAVPPSLRSCGRTNVEFRTRNRAHHLKHFVETPMDPSAHFLRPWAHLLAISSEERTPGVGVFVLFTIEILVLYNALVLAYRLLLHPLHAYPGPAFSKLSDWSIYLQAASGDRHLLSLKEHETYGPVVRIGPNTLSFNTVAALKDIYASRKANVQKAAWYLTIDAPSGAASTHSEIDRSKHAFRRRVLDHAFSSSAIQSIEPIIVENVRIWIDCLGCSEQLDDGWTPPKDMNQWNTYLGYDIMGDLTFGKRFNCLGGTEHRFVPDMMASGTKFIYKVGFHPFIALIRPLLASPVMGWIAGGDAKDNAAYVKYATVQMKERLSASQPSGKPRKDFMYYLLNAKDPESGRSFDRKELDSDASLLISAGSDTISITLSSTMFYLLHNPNSLTKATAEVRKQFASAGDICGGNDVQALKYLRACVDESLRLAPPVPSHLPREVLAGGTAIDGRYLPRGTVVGVSPFAIHHNPEYYPDPFSFLPGRWIVDENAGVSAEQVAMAKAAFCPFSLGPRGCIGRQVAYLEVMIAMATLLYAYDMRLPRGIGKLSGEGDKTSPHWGRQRVGEYQLKDIFIADRNGPMVEFRARK